MFSQIMRVIVDESGQGLPEYALIIASIALLVIYLVFDMGQWIYDILMSVSSTMQNAS